MSEKMLRSTSKMLMLMLLVLSTLMALPIHVAIADGVDVDGVVDETDWAFWFDDVSQSPNFEVYQYMDSDTLYIGVLTDDANDNDDMLIFAFRAMDHDYWVVIKPDDWIKYRRDGGSWEGFWSKARSGLPSGVSAAAGMTDGKRSYELSIELSILKEKAVESPEKIKPWFMVVDGYPDGEVNYYPDSRAGWWWALEFESESESELKTPIEEEAPSEEETPAFHIPELSLGTITALVSMLAALTLFAYKRPTILK